MIAYEHQDAKTFEESISKLYQILTMLRSPEGCPWDREQKPSDISKALLDETYEYIDALRNNDTKHCQEEIGDVLLNAFMILRMHEESSDFAPIEALNTVCAKLVRRHPHVFASASADDSTQVLDLWNSIKENVEGKKRDSENFFSRMPKSLPQLEEACEIQKAMRKVGFDWPDITGVMEKVDEERHELWEAIGQLDTDKAHVEEELGDLLFAIVNLARYLKISPSVALHRANHKIMDRFNKLASMGAQEGIELKADNVEAMNELWNRIKNQKDN
ncbi:MAG: nucleoside triphosphate pyrophosphohydrolase [Spirochaetae bacterium HGW-Spirochaetae-8]|nr:MAG: nucleoside triphosphate pyrophosphohydrolase [Spirochaetae bacterium HGW-Spirochaetae-8]